jgi:hypothetical protein
MVRIAQFGIVLGLFGGVLAFIGLFPGITGVNTTPGLGILQVMALLVGLSMLITGALIYVKFTFYLGVGSTLLQQIGLRLALTGLVFASMSALADIVGFGSNLRTEYSDLYFGPWQAAGLIGSFIISALGVLIFALAGPSDENPPENTP